MKTRFPTVFFFLFYLFFSESVSANEVNLSVVVNYHEILNPGDSDDDLQKDVNSRSDYICVRVEFLMRKECIVEKEKGYLKKFSVLGNTQENFSIYLNLTSNKVRVQIPEKKDVKFFNANVHIGFEALYDVIPEILEMDKYRESFRSICDGFGMALQRRGQMSDVEVKITNKEKYKAVYYESDCLLSTADGKFIHGLTMKSNP